MLEGLSYVVDASRLFVSYRSFYGPMKVEIS